MKLKQLKRANIKNKLFIESQKEVMRDLNSSDLEAFSIEKGEIVTWKSSEIDVPEVIYRELLKLFKDNDEVIAKWLKTPKTFLENKSPIEILKVGAGLEPILDLIERIKTGDLS